MYFQSNRSTRQEFFLNLAVCSPVEGSVSNQDHVSPFSLVSVIADGVDEVRKAAREELRKRAAQIKCLHRVASSFRLSLIQLCTNIPNQNYKQS